MSTRGKWYITMRDIAAGKTPNGMQDREVVELMAKNNPILADVLFQECNKGRENFSTVRTGYPDAVYRSFYEGVSPSKGAKKQVVNSCATLSSALTIDQRLYDQEKDKAALLLDEASAHAEAMGQAVATGLFYGKIADTPKGINGLATTYSVLGGTGTDETLAKFYVLDAKRSDSSDATQLRSIFLVSWGRNSVKGLFPEATNMGLQRGVLESVLIKDENNKDLKVMRQEFNWDFGLEIKDFRFAGRIANIQTNLMDTTGATDLVKLFTRLKIRIKDSGEVRQCLYMDKITFEALALQFYAKTQGNAIQYADLAQKVPTSIHGITVGLSDALNTNETLLTT